MIKAKRPGIDVSAVLFCAREAIPKRIELRTMTGLPLDHSLPGYITGLSGYQRLQGLGYARAYADANDLEMIVVDMLVNFEKPLYPKVLPPEALANHDVLSLFRASKALIGEIADQWQAWVPKTRVNDYDWARPGDFVARRTDLLAKLLDQPEFEHIHVITYPAMVKYHDQPVTATSFKVDYASRPGVIAAASARFHPDIEIVI